MGGHVRTGQQSREDTNTEESGWEGKRGKLGSKLIYVRNKTNHFFVVNKKSHTYKVLIRVISITVR